MNLQIRDQLAQNIFNVTERNLGALAMELYQYQLQYNEVFAGYSSQLQFAGHQVKVYSDIPALPISFFKTHEVVSFEEQPEAIFTSSGTTGQQVSRHFVRSLNWYEQCFMHGFSHFYGSPSNYAFLCLLPSYMERSGSSLIYMAEKLVAASGHKESGFFLEVDKELVDTIDRCRQTGIPVILLGVTFALLDLAERNPGLNLSGVTIMETGGMKGRRKELLRAEVHEIIKHSFGIQNIHSEYGMTELMSQAYSDGNGIYKTPPWMKVLVRSEEDPFQIYTEGAGILIVVDLANIDSCCFIETQDVGRVFADGRFEVLGRVDNSDIRGCSLLVV